MRKIYSHQIVGFLYMLSILILPYFSITGLAFYYSIIGSLVSILVSVLVAYYMYVGKIKFGNAVTLFILYLISIPNFFTYKIMNYMSSGGNIISFFTLKMLFTLFFVLISIAPNLFILLSVYYIFSEKYGGMLGVKNIRNNINDLGIKFKFWLGSLIYLCVVLSNQIAALVNSLLLTIITLFSSFFGKLILLFSISAPKSNAPTLNGIGDNMDLVVSNFLTKHQFIESIFRDILFVLILIYIIKRVMGDIKSHVNISKKNILIIPAISTLVIMVIYMVVPSFSYTLNLIKIYYPNMTLVYTGVSCLVIYIISIFFLRQEKGGQLHEKSLS